MLAGSKRALKGDRVSPLQCHRQLLEQVDGLFGVASDGRCSPSDFPYQFHRLIMTSILETIKSSVYRFIIITVFDTRYQWRIKRGNFFRQYINIITKPTVYDGSREY